MRESVTPPEGIDPQGWHALLALGDRRSYAPGEVVFQDGTRGEHVYVVLEGALEIVKETSPGSDIRLATMRQGDLFGERALFGQGVRSATARARQEVTLVQIHAKFVRDYLDENVAFGKQFYRFLCERFSEIVWDLDMEVRALNRRLEASPSSSRAFT